MKRKEERRREIREWQGGRMEGGCEKEGRDEGEEGRLSS